MKKPILGIIAVFCAQLAFIGYISLERQLETASVPAISGQTLKAANFEPYDDTIEVYRSGSTAVDQSEIKRIAANHSAKMVTKANYVPRKNFIVRNPDLVAIQKPIVIVYPTGKPITFRTEYPAAPTPEADDRGFTASPVPYSAKPYKEKKGFASRALPVLKKPYDWLKAIGAKLK